MPFCFLIYTEILSILFSDAGVIQKAEIIFASGSDTM